LKHPRASGLASHLMTNSPTAINPGSGLVAQATRANAEKNMQHFLTDTGVRGVSCLPLSDNDDDGRYSFILYRGTRCHIVDMPGVPLDQLRFVQESHQNPWDFPRLYVDGSSWLWCFGMLGENDFKEPEDA